MLSFGIALPQLLKHLHRCQSRQGMLPLRSQLVHGQQHKFPQVHARMWQCEPRGVDNHSVNGYDININLSVDVIAPTIAMWRWRHSLLYRLQRVEQCVGIEIGADGHSEVEIFIF